MSRNSPRGNSERARRQITFFKQAAEKFAHPEHDRLEFAGKINVDAVRLVWLRI